MTPHGLDRAIDRALDFAVLPGYSKLGFSLRHLDRTPAIEDGLGGRVALVTGGSSGIGEAACLDLLAAGATVHLLGRDAERTAAAARRIEASVPDAADRLMPELCDISDPAAVRRFAEDFLGRSDRLHLLVNNAGVLTQRRERAADGTELTFATNVLGPFLLTSLLLPALIAAAPSRVITVSSGGMYTARLDADDPQLEEREFDGPGFYAHTKRAEVVLNRLWAERHDPAEIAFHAMHPGWADTGGLRSSLPHFVRLLGPVLRDASQGADTIAFHAMHPGWADTGGLQSSLPRFGRLLGPLLRDASQGADTIAWLAGAPSLDPASGGFWQDRAPRPEHRVPWTRETASDRERLWAYLNTLASSSPPTT